jgi:4-hydroxybenzoate polyprenyltransferase
MPEISMNTLKYRLQEMKPALILFYLSFMGCLCVFSVQMYLKLKFEPLICLCSMGIIFGVYTYNRFTDTQEDFTNDIGRLLFFQKKRGFLFLAVAAVCASFGALLFLHKLAGLHFVLLAVGFCYSYRAIPWYSASGGFRFVRIKEMTFVKNLAVSFLWSASVFAVPILYSSEAVKGGFILFMLGAGMFVSTLNNTLFDDILDEQGDRVAGIKTLPTVWGARKSYLLLWSLDAAWIAAVAACFAAGTLNGGHAAFLAFLGLYPLTYMALHGIAKTPRSIVDFLSESDLLFFALGLMLLSR